MFLSSLELVFQAVRAWAIWDKFQIKAIRVFGSPYYAFDNLSVLSIYSEDLGFDLVFLDYVF